MLTLATANRIIAAAQSHAASHTIGPLCVVVLDAGGHLLAMQRHEDAGIYRTDIATAKAHGCIGMAMGGRAIAMRAGKMPALYSAFNTVTEGGLIPVAGGVLIRDAAGVIIGAVGVSGDTADNDEAVALAGIAAAGLIGDTGGEA